MMVSKKFGGLAVLGIVSVPLGWADQGLSEDAVEVSNVVYLKLNRDGTLTETGRGPTTRVNTSYYDSTGALYYTTTSTPRWHGGDICFFGPENPGITDTTVNLVRFPIAVPANTTESTGRAFVRFWNLDPNRCNATNGVFDTEIGGFFVTINPPGLSTTTTGTIFFVDVAVDDVFPATDGLLFPTDSWGVSLMYRNLDDDGAHPLWSFGFAANMINTADPADPANCTDPLNQPIVGSSIVNGTGDALYMRDADGNGVLTAGPENNCAGTTNEFRGFGATCPQRVIANFLLKLDFDPPPVANAGADITVTDSDNSGAEDVNLDGSLSTDDGAILDWIWAEGATVLSNGPFPTATVSLPVGTHTITMTVTDDFDVTSTDEVIVRVNPAGGGCNCTGDMNADGVRDISDLALFLASFGTSGGGIPTPCADINSDGVVDISDLALMLSNFGVPC